MRFTVYLFLFWIEPKTTRTSERNSARAMALTKRTVAFMGAVTNHLCSFPYRRQLWWLKHDRQTHSSWFIDYSLLLLVPLMVAIRRLGCIGLIVVCLSDLLRKDFTVRAFRHLSAALLYGTPVFLECAAIYYAAFITLYMRWHFILVSFLFILPALS